MLLKIWQRKSISKVPHGNISWSRKLAQHLFRHTCNKMFSSEQILTVHKRSKGHRRNFHKISHMKSPNEIKTLLDSMEP